MAAQRASASVLGYPLILGILGALGWAQPHPPKGVSKQAYGRYLEAVRAAHFQQEAQALSILEEVVRLAPNYEEAWVLKGKLHLRRSEWPAVKSVGQVLQNLRHRSRAAEAWGLYFLGKAYTAEMAYDSARKVWEKFLTASMGVLPRAVQDEGAVLYSQAENAAQLMRSPVPFAPRNLGPAVNSAAEEYLPSLTADGQRLFFTSRRPTPSRSPHPMSGWDEDLYWSMRDSATGQWQPAQPLGPPINSPQNEGAAFFSADGQWAFVTLCDRPDGQGSCDLYFSELQGLRWSPPRNLGPEINSPFWDSHPSLSHDRKRLYFASSRPGGLGGSDLWYSEWQNGKWQKPVNLGPPINTPGDEYSPMIAADGRTLYFASNYHPGMGGQDLFVSFLTDTGWSTPRNLGYPLNTPADEQTLCVDARGEIGYVALVRPDGLGKEDIYEFRLWPEIRPKERASYVRGYVKDAQRRTPLRAYIVLVDVATKDTLRALYSNAATGEFLLSLPVGRRYGLFASAAGYLFYSGHFDLVQSDSAFVIEVLLEPLRKGSRLTLRNIFFDFAKADLRPESEVELEEVVRLLQANPSWRVEIQGHTDSLGSAAYNLELSQRRAEAVRQYLLRRGIAATRLSAKGYGATRPIADNSTEAGRALNRRTEILFIGTD
ncbi:MAG: OmpA family protein [Bacteroidia bacterium]|nr:OmpA family protein [Bacteroidia bacterium]MDW8089555.1 OmpA family protein [Bacteroidia bacterium]